MRSIGPRVETSLRSELCQLKKFIMATFTASTKLSYREGERKTKEGKAYNIKRCVEKIILDIGIIS